jgi:hypothetical protein
MVFKEYLYQRVKIIGVAYDPMQTLTTCYKTAIFYYSSQRSGLTLCFAVKNGFLYQLHL